MLNYDDIAVVVAIAENGSFISASKALEIPSSTISRRVSEFENQLGARLFERNTRSLKLTAKGEELVRACSQEVKFMKHALQTLSRETGPMSGILKVSLPLTLGIDLMSRCFTRFINEYPDIKLELDLDNKHAVLFKQDVDIAIRVGPLKSSGLVAQKLFSTSMILCASPSFIQKHSIVPTNIRSLKGIPFLSYTNTPTTLTALNRQTQIEEKITVIDKFSSNNTFVLKTGCMDGLGLACLPEVSIQQEVDSGELIPLFKNYKFFDEKTVYAVYPSRTHRPDYVKTFIEFMQKATNTHFPG